MFVRNSLRTAIPALLFLGGCQSFIRTDHEHVRMGHHQLKPVESHELVDIGGFVARPQVMEITPAGLTLLQAVTRAGGLRDIPGDSEATIWMITLQRRSAAGQQTFLIPLELVQNEVAGGIPLQDRDFVQIVPYDSTALSLGEPTDAEVGITLVGLVPQPGRYEIKGRLEDLTSTNAEDPIQMRSTIVVVSRPSASGLALEHNLIPLVGVGANKAFLNAHVRPGDVYTFTRLEGIPIVLAGFIENLRRDAAQQAEQRYPRRGIRSELRSERVSRIPGLVTLQNASRAMIGLP